MIQDIITSPIQNIITSPFGELLPPSENLKLWTRFNQGITETGLGVSQWDDQSGNGNHLKQGTDLDRPQKQADGSILTDGIRQFLKTDAFTLVQPETVYILFKQVTWTSADRIFDGNIVNTGILQQISTSPNMRIYAGTAIGNISLALDAYGVVSAVYNSTNSVVQLNNDSPILGDAGFADMGGFTIGARPEGTADFANIQVKEVLVYSEAHDAATRSKAIAYLQSI